MRQAYDYWQDQPGSYLKQTRRGRNRPKATQRTNAVRTTHRANPSGSDFVTKCCVNDGRFHVARLKSDECTLHVLSRFLSVTSSRTRPANRKNTSDIQKKFRIAEGPFRRLVRNASPRQVGRAQKCTSTKLAPYLPDWFPGYVYASRIHTNSSSAAGPEPRAQTGTSPVDSREPQANF